MQFANPIFLWALTGLSIPIGIHLLSRKEGKVIRLGSLRHVQETSTQQFRGIRLNEILLLVLRCLLIVLFTFIISGLHWNNFSKQKWLLIEKGLEKHPDLKSIFDSLTREGYESRFLADDFPSLTDSTLVVSTSYWRLMEQLTSKNVSDVVVFAQNRVKNFAGSRAPLPLNVRWISQPLEGQDYTLQSIQITKDSIIKRQGHTNSETTYFTTERVSRQADATNIELLDTIHIAVVADEKYAYDEKIVKAALNAICQFIPITLKLRNVNSSDISKIADNEWCLWLSDNDVASTLSKIIRIHPQSIDASDLLVQIKSNNWTITKRLNEEVALKENLTVKLALILIPHKQLESKATKQDRRMVSDSIVWTTTKADNKSVSAGVITDTANPYLILLFLGLLFVERSVAYKRNQ